MRRLDGLLILPCVPSVVDGCQNEARISEGEGPTSWLPNQALNDVNLLPSSFRI